MLTLQSTKQFGFSYYEFGMYYQSIFKNIGIYLLISLTLIVHSRYYNKKKSNTLTNFFLVISIFFLIITLVICFFCIIDYNILNQTAKETLPEGHFILVQKWKHIPHFFILIIISLIIYTVLNIKY